ncbi:MAG: oxidoreductase [Bacteroidota bacterium]
MRTALIVGATGLIGKSCLYNLLETKEYTRIIALVRKPLAIKHHQLEQVVVDFNRLATYKEMMVADDIFCCLGTTIRVAGSQDNFRKVDFEYPVEVAKICLQNGATQFLLVSAMGAAPTSSIFYNRVKGEVEQAITNLNYKCFRIFRPSLLLGNRKEVRVGELIAKAVMKVLGVVFIGPLKKYKAIEGETVAKAMVKAALLLNTEKRIYESDEIAALI